MNVQIATEKVLLILLVAAILHNLEYWMKLLMSLMGDNTKQFQESYLICIVTTYKKQLDRYLKNTLPMRHTKDATINLKQMR